MKLFTSFALATALAAPAAFAGGLTEPTPEPMITPVVVTPVTGDWTGFYAGGQLGYGDMSSNTAGVDGDGAIGGLHAGYRHDFGQFVAGAELAYNGSNVEVMGNKGKNLTQLKLMGGYDMGRTLVYGTVGAAHAKVETAGGNRSDTGWLAGVGVDYAINDVWTVGAEYTHNRFDDFDNSGTDAKGNLVQLRVGYRF
ncbi:porin family protein [Pseudorhodobacter turbinis]|uniref:Porin family protein n=1 Tax=Pseudorhodobacter turbinis TaxID=2500533 RepID=A0A4P8EDC2_9RHOB|nr:outer membrane beta-barrel protein [Pseudorhodobacter turbinis]QCO54786.1 porin family protein [Pseudorhodobacter turbinis]